MGLTPPLVQLALFGVSVGASTFFFSSLASLMLNSDASSVQDSYPFGLMFIMALILVAFTRLYDLRIVKHWTSDGAFMAIFFSWALSSLLSLFLSLSMSSAPVLAIAYGWVCGMASAGFERFSIGYILHAIDLPEYQKSHEEFHERLRQRRAYGHYSRSDDKHEILGFIALFIIRLVVLANTLSPNVWIKGYWMGLATEQYFGQLLRVYLQFASYNYDYDDDLVQKHKYKCGMEKRRIKFMANCHHYYWFHLLVNDYQCSGFSAPLWDDLCGRNPLKRVGWNRIWFWIWAWFPWIDFILSDYSDVGKLNHEKWQKYKLTTESQ